MPYAAAERIAVPPCENKKSNWVKAVRKGLSDKLDMVYFSQIQNRISRFTKSSQINCCFRILDGIQLSDQKDYPLWNVLVLIKWIFIYTKDSPFRTEAQIQDVVETLDLIHQFGLEGKVLDFKSEGDVRRSLRIVAYQQLWYQDYVENHVFDKQIVLYALLLHKYDIDKNFQLLTGFTIREFLSISYSVFLYLNLSCLEEGYTYTGFLEEDYLNVFAPKFGKTRLQRFLMQLTLRSIDELAALQKISKEIYQLYETNFLSTKPFLMVDGQLKVPHKAVFGQTCKHFIYDYLKMNDSRFSVELGRRMEKYIQLGLEEAVLHFMNEKQLKTAFPKLIKLVDFKVCDNVLIESKAIELQPNAAVLRHTQISSAALKDSVVKAYCQLLSVAQGLNTSIIYYGLVITYKEAYIGFGTDAWQEFLQKGVHEFIRKNGIDLSVLSPENLCFIDLETWDYLVQAIITHGCSIQEVIEKAKLDNLHPGPRKMLLGQVLKEHYAVGQLSLSYLQNAHSYINVL